MPKPKKRQKMSLSQWARINKRIIKGLTFEEIETHEDRNWRRRPAYRRWREWCLLRDDYHCQFCGSVDKLTVHHIIPAIVCPKLKYDIRNGVTICDDCHKTEGESIHQMRPRFWYNIQNNVIGE